jgi:hypothetical protein
MEIKKRKIEFLRFTFILSQCFEVITETFGCIKASTELKLGAGLGATMRSS